ncbi:MAG: PDZ domain-containing protein [Gammaproteobacteria bacterium]|nr:PDZ domain-containing protein [Gammaproteobacteria bacterium]MDH3767955.1 PDZ domain-containing protein [Gammaproteobacteria bacterium]
MLRQIAMILPIFLAGIVLGAWAREPLRKNTPIPVPVVGNSDTARDFDHAADYQRLEQMISSLTEILNLEVAERRRLEGQISELASQVSKLTGLRRLTPEESKRLATISQQTRGLGNPADSGLSEARFIEAGFPADVAARLKREMDQIALDRLYLRDQAVREGWLGSPRYRDELRALNKKQNEFRESLNSDEYDRYLYALGRPNRVIVSSVLTGSPAGESGLLAGDAILSYDGTRVYSPSEIRRETSGGNAGAVVPIEVMRDGQRQIIYVPRGPLGVNMGATSTRPN